MQERLKERRGGAVLNLKRDETQGWHDSAAQPRDGGVGWGERGRRGGVARAGQDRDEIGLGRTQMPKGTNRAGNKATAGRW